MVSTLDLRGATMIIYEMNQDFLRYADIAGMVLETKGGVTTMVDVRLLSPGPDPQRSTGYKYVFP
jgi:hypothetical protein